MKLLSRGLFAACVVLVAATAVHAAYILPDHRAYRDIDALRVRGHMVVPAATIRPYTRRTVAVGARRLLENGDLGGYEREIAERLMAMFAEDLPGSPNRDDASRYPIVALDVNPRLVVQANPTRLDQPRAHRLPATEAAPKDALRSINTFNAVGRLSERLEGQVRMEADTDGLHDSDLNARRDKTFALGATGYVETAGILYENDWAAASLGRFPVIWGPARNGNLTLSENAPELDAVGFTMHRSWFHFTWFAAQLQPESFTQYTSVNRFVSGHRLVVTPAHWLEIGAGEMINYSADAQNFSLIRSNPVSLLMADEVNSDESSNGFFGLDATLRPARDLEAYVEFGVDDVSLDYQSPHHIGWTAGFRWEAPFGLDRFGCGAEYTRINRWVYSYYNLVNYQRYTNRGSVLGHFMGQDGDALFADGTWETTGGYRVTGLLSHRREGETKLSTRFPKDTSSNFGYHYEPVPWGIVEQATTFGILVEAPPLRGAYVTLGAFGHTLDNAGNDWTDREWDYHLRLDVDWHIPVRF